MVQYGHCKPISFLYLKLPTETDLPYASVQYAFLFLKFDCVKNVTDVVKFRWPKIQLSFIYESLRKTV
jgi:hypothetical protein